MSAATPPVGWTVQLLGLIAAVQFVARDGREMLWCDGEWRAGRDGLLRPAPGIPAATTMAEARRVGCKFIESVDA